MPAARAATNTSPLDKPCLWTATVTTDQPGERLSIHRPPSLEGVEFWSVSSSQRRWSIYHESYTVSHVRGPKSVTAKWRYRGREQTVCAGDIQLMEPGEIHTTSAVSEPASFFVAWYSAALLRRAAEEIELPNPLHLKRSQITNRHLARAFSTLENAIECAENVLEVEECFADATRRLLESCFESRPQPARFGRQHPAVRKARAILDARFAQNVALDQLAAETGLSKFHLARVFTEAVGVPPHRYQTLLRVAAARRRIQAGDSLKQAADAAGFADEPHLTRWFKRDIGVSPGAWRRALRG